MDPASGAYSVIAATCYGNRGAQAMLETVVGTLRESEPGLVFEVFSYYPADDRRLIDAPHVQVHSSTPLALVAWLMPWALVFGVLRRLLGPRVLVAAPSAIRALGRSRALVDLAGVAFIDGREKFLPFNLLTLLPAWLLGVPVVKMPQALGPFEGRLNRACADFMLPRCAMVWARGQRTAQHLAESGFANLRFDTADDIAFNHQARWKLTSEGEDALAALLLRLERARGADAVRGVVGLCPSSVVAARSRKQGGRYEEVLAGLVMDLSAAGFAVLLFPHATRAAHPDAERNNDLPLIRRIVAACARGGLPMPLLAADFDIHASGIKQLIAASDVLLVSRFHAMVGALALGVPVAVLGWSHKYAEVMARFGLQDRVMDYAELDRRQLLDEVVSLFDRRQLVQSRIVEALPEVKASAERPLRGLALRNPDVG